MKAYYFRSKHPKLEIEFPTDGSKPPAKHPCTIQRSQVNVNTEEEDFIPETANTSVRPPSRNAHPARREHSKGVNAINSSLTRSLRNILLLHALPVSKNCAKRSRRGSKKPTMR